MLYVFSRIVLVVFSRKTKISYKNSQQFTYYSNSILVVITSRKYQKLHQKLNESRFYLDLRIDFRVCVLLFTEVTKLRGKAITMSCWEQKQNMRQWEIISGPPSEFSILKPNIYAAITERYYTFSSNCLYSFRF